MAGDDRSAAPSPEDGSGAGRARKRAFWIAAAVFWAGFAVLILVILRLLLPSCGLYLPGAARPILVWCEPEPEVVDPAFLAARERADQLRQQVRDAEQALLDPARCEPEGCPPGQSASRLNLLFAVDGSSSMNRSMGPGRTRMDQARRALRDAVETLPADQYSLLAFNACRDLPHYGPHGREDRSALLPHIDRLRPSQGRGPGQGTAIAAALAEAERRLPPPREGERSIILLLTDGADTCRGDPCATARALAARRPDVTVNVINIGGAGEVRCAADATGGRYVEVNDIEALGEEMRALSEGDRCEPA